MGRASELEEAYTNFDETDRRITESHFHNPTYWLTLKPKPNTSRGTRP